MVDGREGEERGEKFWFSPPLGRDGLRQPEQNQCSPPMRPSLAPYSSQAVLVDRIAAIKLHPGCCVFFYAIVVLLL